MIRRTAGRLATREVSGFVAIGMLCTVAFAALYSVLRDAGVAPLSANAIALTATMVVNFLANRHFTFEASGDPLARQAFRYAVAYALGLGVSTLILAAAHALAQHPRGVLDTALAVGSALGATAVRFVLMRRWVFAPPAGPAAPLVVLVAIVISAAGVSTGAAAAGQAGNPCLAFHSGETEVTVAVQGVERTAVVRVPPGASRTAQVPLVVGFHGSGKSGRQFEGETGLDRLADRAGFIAVFPDAAPPSHVWQVNERGTYDLPDVRFIDALMDVVRGQACIDPTRMYAVGLSNGGGMAARVACELADRFAAVAIVAGGYSTLPACAPARPLSILEIHGTADTAAPYSGRPFGPGGSLVGSVRSFVGFWVRHDGCTRKRVSSLGAGRALLSWTRCADGTEVQHVRIAGGAHGWPGGNPYTAKRPAGLIATDAVWRFLRSQHRAPDSPAGTTGGSAP